MPRLPGSTLVVSTGVARSWRNKLPGTASRSRAAFSCNEPTGRLVELIKARALNYGTFSEASPAGFYSRSPAAHHWSPRRCGVPPNLTESSSPSRVQTTPSVNKWSVASRRSVSSGVKSTSSDMFWTRCAPCEERVLKGSRTGRARCAMPLPIGMSHSRVYAVWTQT